MVLERLLKVGLMRDRGRIARKDLDAWPQVGVLALSLVCLDGFFGGTGAHIAQI
jgi:hypothetical protein